MCSFGRTGEEEEVPSTTTKYQHNCKPLCVVKLSHSLVSAFMHRFVRGLVSSKTLATSYMSSPKFHSPSQSQAEMLGSVLSTGGKNGHEQEGEGNANNGGSLCGQDRRESIEPCYCLSKQHR